MKSRSWFLAGLLVAIAGGAAAITAGGFPAQPFLQRIFGPQGNGANAFGAGFVLDNKGGLWFNNLGTASTFAQGMHWNGSSWICDIGGGGAAGALQVVGGAAAALSASCASVGSSVTPSSANILPISCTTSCNVSAIAVGQSAIIRKGSATSRASTTTLADDPDLIFTSVPNGTYHVSYDLVWSVGAGGYKDLAASSGATINLGAIEGCQGVSTVAVSASVSTCASTVGGVTTGQGVNGVNGTLSIQWAQNTSNAANSSLLNGSDLIVTRVQ